MATLVADLVQQTSTSIGTGNFTLVAPIGGFQSFSNVFSTGGIDVFYYCIINQSAAEFEFGTGHMSDAATLVRDTVISASQMGSTNFSAGAKIVTCDIPGENQADLTQQNEWTAQQTFTNSISVDTINGVEDNQPYIFYTGDGIVSIGDINNAYDGMTLEINANANFVYASGDLSVGGNIYPSTNNNTGGGQYQFGPGAWGGQGPATTNIDAATGITYTSESNVLFTFSSDGDQNMSVQVDGCLFLGDSIGYNPQEIDGSYGGFILAQNGIATGGNAFVQETVNANQLNIAAASYFDNGVMTTDGSGNLTIHSLSSCDNGEVYTNGYGTLTAANFQTDFFSGQVDGAAYMQYYGGSGPLHFGDIDTNYDGTYMTIDPTAYTVTFNNTSQGVLLTDTAGDWAINSLGTGNMMFDNNGGTSDGNGNITCAGIKTIDSIWHLGDYTSSNIKSQAGTVLVNIGGVDVLLLTA